MSKATITGETGAGRYTVRLEYDKTASLARIAQITALIADLDTSIAAQELALTDLLSDLSLASILLTNAIQSGNPSLITDAEPIYYQSVRAAELAQSAIYRDKSRRFSLAHEKTFIESRTPDQSGAITATAWCGDYTEGLTGEVGLIEVENGSGDYKVIQPGYSLTVPPSAYDAVRDGAQTPGVSTYSGSALYRNAALLDAWELFTPLYRSAVITAIAGDTCSITIDAQQTRYLTLDANREIGGTLTGVTIDYMDCHGGAFNIGDRVLVAFVNQSVTAPRVIGFVDNPVPCQIHGVYARGAYANNVLRYHSASNTWASRVNNTSIPSYSYWQGKYVSGSPTAYLAYNHGFAYIHQYGQVVAPTPQKIQGAAMATYSGVDYYIVVCKNHATASLSTGDDFWRRPVGGSSWTLIGSVPHSVYGLAATYEHMFPAKDTWPWRFSGDGLKALHHQRIIIATAAFDASGDSWENEVPSDQPYYGINTSNNDYYQTMTGGADRKAAIIEVTIAADLASLTHSIEWTGSYSKTVNSGSTPTPGTASGGGSPPDMAWDTEVIAWSSIFDVDYQDGTRVNLIFEFERDARTEVTPNWTDSGLVFHSQIADAYTHDIFRYKLDSTTIATSTLDVVRHRLEDSGIESSTADYVSYCLGAYDLRTADFALYKEVITTTMTSSGPHAAPVTSARTITESSVFINSGATTTLGTISSSITTTDTLSEFAKIALMPVGGGTFLDMHWAGYHPTSFIYNTLDGGKAQAVIWRSRWQDASDVWHFDAYLLDGKQYAQSKLTGTSDTINDVAGFSENISVMGII